VKTCRKCYVTKPLSEFHKQGGPHGGKDGVRSVCKECRKDRYKTEHVSEALVPYSYKELRYRPIEHALEQLTCKQLAAIWGIDKDVANQIKREPWVWPVIERDVDSRYVLDAEKIRQLRVWLERAAA
jgi:hypothetical protein